MRSRGCHTRACIMHDLRRGTDCMPPGVTNQTSLDVTHVCTEHYSVTFATLWALRVLCSRYKVNIIEVTCMRARQLTAGHGVNIADRCCCRHDVSRDDDEEEEDDDDVVVVSTSTSQLDERLRSISAAHCHILICTTLAKDYCSLA